MNLGYTATKKWMELELEEEVLTISLLPRSPHQLPLSINATREAERLLRVEAELARPNRAGEVVCLHMGEELVRFIEFRERERGSS